MKPLIVSFQCYLAALENRDAPPPPEIYSKTSKAQPPPAPGPNVPDGAPAAVPPPPEPAPPPAMLVPPVEEPDDEEFEEDELHCKVIYYFQGNTRRAFSLQFLLGRLFYILGTLRKPRRQRRRERGKTKGLTEHWLCTCIIKLCIFISRSLQNNNVKSLSTFCVFKTTRVPTANFSYFYWKMTPAFTYSA